MTFGWQGFTLEHPEDWAPVTLSGGRSEGYARIASPSRISFQVRWKASKQGVDRESVLTTYLDRLRQDAKRAKKAFECDLDKRSEVLQYRYSSEHYGRGAILQSASCGRIFFLEAISTKNDSLLPIFRKLLESFSSRPAQKETPCERWALFGLDITLPTGLDVEKKVLQSGRTQLNLVCKDAHIEANRWGFAEQLIAKHGLEPWSRSVLRVPAAQMETSVEGVMLMVAGTMIKRPQTGMARVQSDRNQITTIMVTSRKDEWRPSWDWFN